VYSAISLEPGAWSEGFEGKIYVHPYSEIDLQTGKTWWKADHPSSVVWMQNIDGKLLERTLGFLNPDATLQSL
jgi:hypothetical protein